MAKGNLGLSELRRAYHARREYAKDLRWARAAERLGERVLSPGSHHAVVTCGPPHMVHEAGRRLADRFSLPHVVDMRDPWSEVERLPEASACGTWLRLASRYERRCVSAARLVVANTEPAAEALRRRYPEAASRVLAVMNGFDTEPLPPGNDGGRFTLAYAGTVYLDRDPRPLFRAAAEVARDLQLDPSSFGIELMGEVQKLDGRDLAALAEECGAAEFVRLHPPGRRSEAMRFLSRSTMLVNLPQDSKLAIPSKVFEYLRFPAWILAMEEPDSATARVLAGRADVVPPRDEAAIAAAIRRRVLEYLAGARPEPAAPPDLSRQAQASVLCDALDRIKGSTEPAYHM